MALSLAGLSTLHADLTSYDAAIAADHAGALPYASVSRDVLTLDGTAGLPFDFGSVDGSSTIEFIVGGDPDANVNGYLAVGENATWNLRYEQWQETEALGFTHLGVADYLFESAEGADANALLSPRELAHVTFRWVQDTTTMELYLNGVLVGTNAEAAEFQMPTGEGSVGANPGGAEAMTGTIERITVYNDAIDPSAILFHAEAWLGASDPGVAVNAVQDFGELPFIDDVQTLTIPVRNSGATQPLTLAAEIVSGTHFTITELPSELGPSQEGAITLQFDRQGRIGTFDGILRLTTNDPDAVDQQIDIVLSAALVDREGPVAHYRLDDIAGTSVMPDASGFGRDGTYGENVSLEAEALASGNAMAVSGGAQAMVSGEHFGTPDIFTVALWMETTDASQLQTLVAKGSAGSPTFAVLLQEGKVTWFADAAPQFQADTVIENGTPYHVAAAFTPERVTVYVNGALVAEQADPLPLELDVSNSLMLGAFEGGLPFAGRLDDFQVYDRALTEAQVMGLYQNPGSVVTSTLSTRPPVAAEWLFDRHLSDTAPGGVGDVLQPSGTVAYGAGLEGQAAAFSADEMQRVQAAGSDDLNLDENWTLETYLWPARFDNATAVPFWEQANGWRMALQADPDNAIENALVFSLDGATDTFTIAEAIEIPMESWTHLAVIGDVAAGTITVWRNGSQVAEAAYQAPPASGEGVTLGGTGFEGFLDEAIIHATAVSEAYLLERAEVIDLPQFYPIVSIESSTAVDDFYPVENLIQGPGVGFAAEPPFRRLVGGADGSWVTADPGGFPADYLDVADAPVLLLDLGTDVTLEEISVWGYAASNANGVSEFGLRFATAAEGPEAFGQSIAYAPTFMPANTDAPRQSFFFEESVVARYVEFTALDNYFVAPGDGSEGGAPGGDRVGLGEIAFEIDPEPEDTSGGPGAGGAELGALRESLGAVAGSGVHLTEPTMVDFGVLSGDATYEFVFEAFKGGPSTAIAGNANWGVKLEQWQDQGVFGTTEFGVADHVFDPEGGNDPASVFEERVHVALVQDFTNDETRLYVNGTHVGNWLGTVDIQGEGWVMAAGATGNIDPMPEGSTLFGWATYGSALDDTEILALTETPFGDGNNGGGGDEMVGVPEVNMSANGALEITLPEGAAGEVEYSQDLITWDVLTTEAGATFEETNPDRQGRSQGYYRVR